MGIMAANRVKSKDLFNFRPSGVIDADILEKEKAMHEAFGLDVDEMKKQMAAMSDEEMGVSLNGMMDGMAKIMEHPIFSEAENSCDQSTLSVPTTHDGAHAVRVLVHSPKALDNDTFRACIVYAHGGGAVAGSPDVLKVSKQCSGFLRGDQVCLKQWC